MDRTNVGERAFATATQTPGGPEAIEFVRFCYRRRRVGWPELYDEMCAVAGRGLYQGYRAEELAALGIGFGLFQMPALAVLVGRVVAEDVERRRRTAAAIRATMISADGDVAADGEVAATSPDQHIAIAVPSSHDGPAEPGATDIAAPDREVIRLAVAAGARA